MTRLICSVVAAPFMLAGAVMLMLGFVSLFDSVQAIETSQAAAAIGVSIACGQITSACLLLIVGWLPVAVAWIDHAITQLRADITSDPIENY